MLYDLRRGGSSLRLVELCARHLKARKALGWKVIDTTPVDNGECFDCEEAGSTVLDRRIEADDARAKRNEAPPIPVLPGQRRLF